MNKKVIYCIFFLLLFPGQSVLAADYSTEKKSPPDVSTSLTEEPIPAIETTEAVPPLIVWLNLIDFSPKTGDIDARIFVEAPDYYIGDTESFNKTLILVDKSNVENTILVMEKGIPYQKYSFLLHGMYEVSNINDAFFYPFDKQSVDISVFVSDINHKRLPVELNCELCGFPFSGYHFDVLDRSSHDLIDFTLQFKRKLSTIIFSCVLNITFLFIGIIISVFAYRVAAGAERVETGLLAFVGSLMFALPVMREIQPGTPPVGVLIDYIGLFFAEVLIIISLIIIVIYWFRQISEKINSNKFKKQLLRQKNKHG